MPQPDDPPMPFGKFKGTPISELPNDYLAWLTSIELKSPLRETVFAEIEVRRLREAEAGSRPDPAADIPHAVVQRWYRQLTLKYHPDRGGSHEGMIAVTEAKDLLVAMIEESQGARKAA